jgi:hypothetical protein
MNKQGSICFYKLPDNDFLIEQTWTAGIKRFKKAAPGKERR